ncbi:MAG TPA: hypothetical protein VHV82_20365 [Sporichthyaceae bacterium]|jgi:hypothetical protein|nr:hypothetical protein [Sporichthyaceae bacterium]
MSNRKQCAGWARLKVGVPLALGLLVATAMPTWAAPAAIPVTNVACGPNAATNLISAIMAANALAPAPQILSLNPCNYVLTASLTDAPDELYGATGTPVIANTIAIRGNGATISRSATASSSDPFRILTVGPLAQLSIDSVTIKGGIAGCAGSSATWCSGTPSVDAFGGGIGVVGGNLGVYGATLIGNTATCGTVTACKSAAGGAIGAQDDAAGDPSVVLITDSTLDHNTASCADTAAADKCKMAAGGAADATNSDLHVLRSQFHDNSASCIDTGTGKKCKDAFGGALDVGKAPDEVTVSDSEFDHNSVTSDQAAGGGAITILKAASTLANNLIQRNAATSTGTTPGTGGIGGGLLIEAAQKFANSITGGTVEQNTAIGGYSGGGGGIAAGANLSLADVSVNDNSATGAGLVEGGGVVSTDSLRAVRTHIDNNSVSGGESVGGGVAAAGSVVLENGSVSNNYANGSSEVVGGGLYLAAATASLVDEQVSWNSVKNPVVAVGGGIFAESSTVIVQRGRMEGNKATSSTSGEGLGGGVYTAGGRFAALGGTQIVDNSASGPGAAGGGIYNAGLAEVDPPSAVYGNNPDQCAPAGSVVGC